MSQVTYELDPAHTSVHFSVRHMMVSNVRGEFAKVSGTVKRRRFTPATINETLILRALTFLT